MPLALIPPMSDCFELLPLWAREILSISPGHKDWKRCQSCDAYKDVATLKKCGACSKYRVQPICYCSQRCQKAHWPVHKDDCRIIQERDRLGLQNPEDKAGPLSDRKLKKAVGRWYGINTQTVLWALRHAYYYSAAMDTSKTVFDVELDLSTFQIISFQFTPKNDSGFGDFFSQSHFSHLQGADEYWIQIKVNFRAVGKPKYCRTMTRKRFSPRELSSITDDAGGPFPESPWVAAHLTRKEEKSNWVAVKKWDLFITVVHCLRLGQPRDFANFKAPVLKIGTPFCPTGMRVWYQTMCRRDVWESMVQFGYVKQTLDRECIGDRRSFAVNPRQPSNGSLGLNITWMYAVISLVFWAILESWRFFA